VRKGEWEVRDVQNVADILVDPEGSLECHSACNIDPLSRGIGVQN
jgi:hypothetical protein